MKQAYDLRPYQKDAIKQCVGHLMDQRTVLLESPVGSGKTVMAMAIGSQLQRPTLVVSHRRELNEQMMAAARAYGVRAKQMTVQGYARTSNVTRTQTLRGFGLIVVDECHRSQAPYYRKLLSEADDSTMVLGTTATPARLDNQSLFVSHGGFFDEHVVASTTRQLVQQGYILDPRVFTCDRPIDIRTLDNGGKEFQKDALEKAVRTKYFNGGVVDNWCRKAQGKSTLVFAVSRQHGKALAIRFHSAGINVAYVDAFTDLNTRAQILSDFKNRKHTVLINVQLCAEGWDWPDLECVVLATSTKSTVYYRQMCGRVMRNAIGKKRPIVLDHGRNVYMHGMPGDDWHMANDVGPRMLARLNVKTCPVCLAVVSLETKVCECGHDFRTDRVWQLGYDEVPVQLVEINHLARKYDMRVDAHDCWLPTTTPDVDKKFPIRRNGKIISLRQAVCCDLGWDVKGFKLRNFCRNASICVNPEHITNVREFDETMPCLVAHWSTRNPQTDCLEWMRAPVAREDFVTCGITRPGDAPGKSRARSQSPTSFMRSQHHDVEMLSKPVCDNDRCINPEHFSDKRTALRQAIATRISRIGQCDIWQAKTRQGLIVLSISGISQHANSQDGFSVKQEILRQTGFTLPHRSVVKNECGNKLCVRGSHLYFQAEDGKFRHGKDL